MHTQVQKCTHQYRHSHTYNTHTHYIQTTQATVQESHVVTHWVELHRPLFLGATRGNKAVWSDLTDLAQM